MKDCITISLFCIGLYIAQSSGYILEMPRAILQKAIRKIGKHYDYIEKPLFRCPMCMSSFYTIAYYCAFGIDVKGGVLVAIPVVCALNSIFITLSKDVLQ